MTSPLPVACHDDPVDWGETLLRALMQIVLLVGLLTLYIGSHGGTRNSGAILYLPFFLGIPALLISLFLLAPAEVALREQVGGWAHPAIVALGAGLPWLLVLLRGRLGQWDGAVMLSVIFGGWALLWVATRPLYMLIAG